MVPYSVPQGNLAHHATASICKEHFLFSDNLFVLFNNFQMTKPAYYTYFSVSLETKLYHCLHTQEYIPDTIIMF